MTYYRSVQDFFCLSHEFCVHHRTHIKKTTVTSKECRDFCACASSWPFAHKLLVRLFLDATTTQGVLGCHILILWIETRYQKTLFDILFISFVLRWVWCVVNTPIRCIFVIVCHSRSIGCTFWKELLGQTSQVCGNHDLPCHETWYRDHWKDLRRTATSCHGASSFLRWVRSKYL